MPTFKSVVEVQKYLEIEIRKILIEVHTIVWQKLYDYIEQEIYVNKTLKISSGSDGYEQTGEFLDYLWECKKGSVIKINDSTYQTTIYFNDRNGNSRYISNKFFNQRMSLNGDTSYEGKEVSEWLLQWLDTGIDSPYYTHTGIGYMEFITEWLSRNYDEEVRKAFVRHNIPITT